MNTLNFLISIFRKYFFYLLLYSSVCTFAQKRYDKAQAANKQKELKNDFKKPLLLDILKPINFQNVILPAEKSSKKKFTFLREFYNNATTRYNFIYNSKRWIKEMIDSAQENYKDDFTLSPITFLNYDAKFLAKTFSKKLDSLLIKTTSGILLHDLRNKWAPSLYLYMGQAYFYKQDYDSALLIFQYLNYQYDSKYENRSYVTNSGQKKLITAATIVNREKNGLWAKLSSNEDARNDALVWIVRTYIELGAYEDAGAMIATLDKDIFFPERLRPFYDETKAYYYYQRKQYTISAQHLTNTINLSKDRQEKARRCYLISQLYNLDQREDLATQYLKFSIEYTYDPVLEIYSRINYVLQERHPNVYIINDHIKEMLQLLNKERFMLYKDLIYYGASLMSIKKSDLDEAITFIHQSMEYADLGNTPNKNMVYLKLFQLFWKKQNYLQCAYTLDSISQDFISQDSANAFINKLRSAFKNYAEFSNAKKTQDSLQSIAKLSKIDREKFVINKAKGRERELKKMIVKYKQEVAFEKFSTSKNNWSFDNKNNVVQGIQEFQATWGNRKNTDNWRRKAALSYTITNDNVAITKTKPDTLQKVFYKNLLQQIEAEIPLSKEAKEASDKIISNAIYNLADIYYLNFKDYKQAIDAYKDVISLYPNSNNTEDAFANLYFLYKDENSKVPEHEIEKLKTKYIHQYPDGKYKQLFMQGSGINYAALKEDLAYEKFYEMYIDKKYTSMNEAYKNFISEFPTSTHYYKTKLLLGLSHTYLRQKDVAIKIARESISEMGKLTLSETDNLLLEEFKKMETLNKATIDLQ